MGCGASSAAKNEPTPNSPVASLNNSKSHDDQVVSPAGASPSAKYDSYRKKGGSGRRASFGAALHTLDATGTIADSYDASVFKGPSLNARSSQSFTFEAAAAGAGWLRGRLDESGVSNTNSRISSNRTAVAASGRVASSKRSARTSSAKFSSGGCTPKASTDTLFFGTIDGFGPHADALASFIRLHLRNFIAKATSEGLEANIDGPMDTIRSALSDLKQRIEDGQVGVDLSQTGASVTVASFNRETRELQLGSIGNCRLCILKRNGDALVQLSADHTWANVSERERAESKGAVVKVNKMDNVGEMGKPAVWFNADAKKPGLTMSRILGYSSASAAGVIDEVEYRSMRCPTTDGSDGTDPNESVQVVVLATQGLWEVCSDEEVANMIRRFRTQSNAAVGYVDAAQVSQLLLDEATEKWEQLWTDHAIEVQAFFPDLFSADGIVPARGSFSPTAVASGAKPLTDQEASPNAEQPAVETNKNDTHRHPEAIP